MFADYLFKKSVDQSEIALNVSCFCSFADENVIRVNIVAADKATGDY